MEQLLDLNVAAGKIKEHVYNVFGKKVTTKDIHNIRLSSNGGKKEEEDLVRELECLLRSHPGADVRLIVNAKSELELIYLQTSSMKDAASRFHQVIIADTTYKINNKGMPLSSLMVIDGNGSGQLAAQAILSNEKKETLQCFMKTFQELNPACKNTSVFLVDKDFSEMAIIKDLWPQASIHICLFHCLKALRLQIFRTSGSEDTRKKLVQSRQQLAFARTEEAYNELYQDFQQNAPGSFVDYYTKNWHSCRDMWAGYARKECANYGQRTTNMLESYHQKRKRNCHGNMTLSQFIHQLVQINDLKDARMTHEVFRQKMTVSCVHGDNSTITQKLEEICTPYAAGLVRDNIEKSKKIEHLVAEDEEGKFTVTSSTGQYAVTLEKEAATCSCSWFRNMNLPCSHIFKA